jgi:protein tyrosine/serine phosphatase
MATRLIKSNVVVCLLVLAVSISAQEEARYKELPNFHRVSGQLFRGAQPGNGGIKKLSELGIKTIVNLRGTDELTAAQQKEAEAAGLHYFNIPMPGLSSPSDDQVAKIMDVINNPDNQPVFIHCKRGADRTGTITAVYRISHEDWTAERAIAEAKRFGMSWAEFGMRNYIENFYKQQYRKRSQPAAAAVSR